MANVSDRSRLIPLAISTGAGLAAFAVAAWIVRPLRTALVGSDTASSVLYFDRIVHGERLERFLGTTPKPLLTLVDGLLHAISQDWRPVAWLALVVYAVAIGASVALAHRISGPVAAAFVGAALIASAGLLQDAALAYAVSWALLALSVTGLLVTSVPPRYGAAGLTLAIGSLARQEVLIVVLVTCAIVVTRWLLGRFGLRVRPPRDERRLLLGLVAIPISMAHDMLLAGDPLYSLRVPVLGAEGRAGGGLTAAIDALLAHGLGNGPLLILAGIGVVALYRNGPRQILLGIVTVVFGVMLLVLIVGARGLVVLDRYALPMELALVLSAGCGVAVVLEWALGRFAPRTVLCLVALVLALGVSSRIGPLDRATTGQIHDAQRAARAYAAILPSVRTAVDAEPALRVPPSFRDPTARDVSGPALYITPRLLSIALVDLDLQLDRVARLTQLDPLAHPPVVGTMALRVAAIDTAADAPWTGTSGQTGQLGVSVQVLDHVGDRAWLVRIDPAIGAGPDGGLPRTAS